MSRSRDQVLQVKQANDLVAVIQEYEELQRNGRNYKLRCPFHAGKHGGREDTPSLYVYPDKQSWHCFGGGCGRGGTVIDWVMEIEGLSFADALKHLANRAGIELEQIKKQRPRTPGEVDKDGLQTLLREARDWFVAKFPQSKADSYVAGRGITADTIKTFGIGYSPDGWEVLKKHLARRWSEKALMQTGLLVERDGGDGYDRFRDRLMIPICDPTGNVLGFGARDLSADGKGGAKYINTPKTELYDKSRVLFGIDHARDPIRQSKHAIIMEGYTDVMMAHQFGVANAVAVCGTAFTEGHLQLLRQADRLTLLFDGDAPGMTAAERALEQLVAKEVQASIVVLPDGLDPADYLQQRGAEAFMAELEHGLGPVEFKLSAVRRRHDFDNPVEHAHAAEECIQLMRAAQSPVFREALLHKFAAGLGLREETLRKQMNDEDAKEAERERRRQRFQQQDQAAAAAPPQTAAAAAATSFAPSSPSAASSASARPSTHRRAANSMVLSPFTLEETAVACALSDPELIDELDQQFGPGAFPDGPLRRIVEGIIDMLHSDPDADPKRDTLVSDLMTLLDDEARAELRRLIHRRLGDALYEDTPVAAEDGLFVPARPREIFAACVAERRARDAARETRAAFDRHLVTAARTDDPAGSPSDETRRLAAQHLALLRERKRGAKRTDESAGAVGGASA